MEEIIKDLKKYKEEIDLAKGKIARLEGQKEELLKRLKSEFNLNSLAEAQKQMEKDLKELQKLKQEVEDLYNELKEKFEC